MSDTYEPPFTDRDGNLKLDAYYYGFDQTGVDAVDIILSAVAHAGKLAHHTEAWREHFCWRDNKCAPHVEICPESSVGVIVAAAREAARRWKEVVDDAT